MKRWTCSVCECPHSHYVRDVIVAANHPRRNSRIPPELRPDLDLQTLRNQPGFQVIATFLILNSYFLLRTFSDPVLPRHRRILRSQIGCLRRTAISLLGAWRCTCWCVGNRERSLSFRGCGSLERCPRNPVERPTSQMLNV